MTTPRSAATLLLALCAALPACASDGPVKPELPGRPTLERPEGLVPDGVVEMREQMAQMRAENREAMDMALVRPTTLTETQSGPSPVWGFLNDVGNTALDVFSLKTFGIW